MLAPPPAAEASRPPAVVPVAPVAAVTPPAVPKAAEPKPVEPKPVTPKVADKKAEPAVAEKKAAPDPAAASAFLRSVAHSLLPQPTVIDGKMVLNLLPVLAAIDPLDADDVGPQVAQQRGAVGPGDEAAEVEDADAGQ